ncbi:MAG: septum formation initiator family protein [Clostridiales bacterium]|nr:septum formation initiator family protein [Clostridiales bacterium]
MARKGYTLKLRARLFITGVILCYFLFLIIQQSFDIQGQNNTVAELQNAITNVQLENEALSRQIDHTRSDDYIEQAARDKLGWVKDGETIFIEKNK